MTAASRSLLDDPAEWASFGRALAPREGRALWQSHVLLQGMHCPGCALTIENAIAAVPGVSGVRVNSATGRASVTWSPDLARPSAWWSAIERAGYGAVPAADARVRDANRAASRRLLWRWAVAGFCMMQVMMYAWPAYVAAPGDLSDDSAHLLRWASWMLTIPVLLFSCGPFFRGAWRDAVRGRVGMDVPVSLGIAIAFAVSTAATFGPGRGEVYFDSLTMFLFFLLTGRWLQARLAERTSGAMDALMNRLPEGCERRSADGSFERVALRRVGAGDVLRVCPGEAFAVDGVLIEGRTEVDEALLTGEAKPLERAAGESVLAGSHNLAATVLMRVERIGADTRYAQIVRLMDEAASHRPHTVALADRVARWFLMFVLLAALAAAALAAMEGADGMTAAMRAAIVLIVTCPCALSLATPATLLAAAGALARKGVLVRRLGALQRLAEVDAMVFDKTGTLSLRGLSLVHVQLAAGADRRTVLDVAAAVAAHSLHPVARALVTAGGETTFAPTASHAFEAPGAGVGADIDGTAYRLGSAAFCGIAERADGSAFHGTQAHLAGPHGWLASFGFAEAPRADLREAMEALRTLGIEARMLSGDRPEAVARMAARAGISKAIGNCTPEDKRRQVRALQRAGRVVAMVGDGMNDTPVLAAADVSIAFGEAVPLARARSDVVVLGGELLRVVDAVRVARQAVRVLRQNIAWAVVYNGASVPLALAGLMPAWAAGAGMAASSLLVVANAARLAVPERREGRR